ncbi:MAG: prepilin-type N-terminal cleavage/methylation domain-containing protein [Lentisphaeria bacterium]|nr:prepilin-type N-terminal cleavage/methylation domain-containing protein [Lentisphaeria bacterium]
MKNCQSKKRAFTLIELLVVIAITAITTNNSIKVKHIP